MKEIVDGIWNAPKEQVYQTLNYAVIAYGVGSLISVALFVFMYRQMNKQWEKRKKEFDDRFNNITKFR